jgi:predicted aldo/keto reductase-like oxidoreductase
MKTVGSGSIDRLQGAPEIAEEDMELLSKLTGKFLKKGFTDIQARLMAVWQNPHIASICSYMPSMAILESNVSAALNWKKLSRKDMKILKQYAKATSSGYCTGCATICKFAVGGNVPISDVMRFLMYYHGYGERDQAKSLFNELSLETRRRIAKTDYSMAERKCPQKIAIGKLMKNAARTLA